MLMININMGNNSGAHISLVDHLASVKLPRNIIGVIWEYLNIPRSPYEMMWMERCQYIWWLIQDFFNNTPPINISRTQLRALREYLNSSGITNQELCQLFRIQYDQLGKSDRRNKMMLRLTGTHLTPNCWVVQDGVTEQVTTIVTSSRQTLTRNWVTNYSLIRKLLPLETSPSVSVMGKSAGRYHLVYDVDLRVQLDAIVANTFAAPADWDTRFTYEPFDAKTICLTYEYGHSYQDKQRQRIDHQKTWRKIAEELEFAYDRDVLYLKAHRHTRR